MCLPCLRALRAAFSSACVALVLLLCAPGAQAQLTFVVNDTRAPAFDTDPTDRRCDVDAGAEGDQCTFGLALYLAQYGSPAMTATERVTITFSLPGATPVRLLVQDRAVFTRPVTLDGTTQPGYAGAPVVVIGQNKTDAQNLPFLSFQGGASIVRGLAFNYVTDIVLSFVTLAATSWRATTWASMRTAAWSRAGFAPRAPLRSTATTTGWVAPPRRSAT